MAVRKATAVEGGQQHSPCSLLQVLPCMDSCFAVARVMASMIPAGALHIHLVRWRDTLGDRAMGWLIPHGPISPVLAVVGGEESKMCPWPWACVPPTMPCWELLLCTPHVCHATRKATKSSGICSSVY